MGVNTATLTDTLTVNGNITVSNYIKTIGSNQNMHLVPNGLGQVIISNVNILQGNIDASDIGLTNARAAKFTTANTSAKATFQSAQVTNLTPGRIVFSDGTGLTDDPDLLFFTGNNTFYATNIESAGTVGYLNLNITGEFTYNRGTINQIPFFAANSGMITDTKLSYFTGNGIVSSANVIATGQTPGQIVYVNSNKMFDSTPFLTYDGINLTAGLTTQTTLAGVRIRRVAGVPSIETVGTNDNLLINPNGLGYVDVNAHYVRNLGFDDINPLDDDAVPYRIVKDVLQQASSTTIIQGTSQAGTLVQVRDNGSVGSIRFQVFGSNIATFGSTFSNLYDLYFNAGTVGTTAGELSLSPNNNERVRVNTNTAITIPYGDSGSRPDLPVLGDFRLNTDNSSIEWWDGAGWNDAGGPNTVASQTLFNPTSPNGITTVFTLQQAATTNSVIVSINGTLQQPQSAYSVSGTQITFTEAPQIGDTIEVRFLTGSVAYATNPITVSSGFANLSTTSFTSIDNVYVAQFRSAKYAWTAKNTSTGQYQIGEAYLIHNSITANVVSTVISTMGANTQPIVYYSTNITGGGIVQLTAQGFATTGNIQVKIHRTYFDDT
jgi:hypothetical protein